jgi:hypothetical protein
LLGSCGGQALDIKTCCTESKIKSLGKEILSCGWQDLFNHRKKNRHELVCKKTGKIVSGCVNPSVKEIVETIRKTFSLEKEILSCLRIKVCAHIVS